MKFPSVYTALFCGALFAASATLAADAPVIAATNSIGPRIEFNLKDYHFGKIMAGEIVKYTFFVTNTGDATLEITKVQPSCGCTTAGSWSHEIAAGQTGEIPLQFNSGNFHGDVKKTITVISNDRKAPVQSLTLQGTIWRAIEITPQYAYITVPGNEAPPAPAMVHIVAQGDHPVTLSEPQSANNSFKAELKTIQEGKEFELVVTALPPFAPGNTSATISIKTSLTNMPVINVTAIAMTQPALMVSPPNVSLPPPVDRWTTNTVSIRATRSRSLTLSEPTVSDQRVIASIKEITPGRLYTVTLAFPPNFEITQGERVQLSVKSNQPQDPLIRVPIVQIAHRTAAQLAPPAHLPPGSPGTASSTVLGHP